MGKRKLKVRSSPENSKRQEIEDRVNPLCYYLLTVSVFSINRATLSLGGLKPNFIKDEKRSFEKPPLLKRHM